jgi:broad specificity phosphatase PhoE
VLHLVRHGESEYNAACGAPGSSWDEPLIFDAPLSTLGRAQASALGPALAALVSTNVLWVTSPLTRAIQTCLLVRARANGALCLTYPALLCLQTPTARGWLADARLLPHSFALPGSLRCARR